jgi:hypothetical protein
MVREERQQSDHRIAASLSKQIVAVEHREHA